MSKQTATKPMQSNKNWKAFTTISKGLKDSIRDITAKQANLDVAIQEFRDQDGIGISGNFYNQIKDLCSKIFDSPITSTAMIDHLDSCLCEIKHPRIDGKDGGMKWSNQFIRKSKDNPENRQRKPRPIAQTLTDVRYAIKHHSEIKNIGLFETFDSLKDLRKWNLENQADNDLKDYKEALKNLKKLKTLMSKANKIGKASVSSLKLVNNNLKDSIKILTPAKPRKASGKMKPSPKTAITRDKIG